MEGLQLVYDSRGLYLWLGLLFLFVILALWVAVIHARASSMVAHYRALTRGMHGESMDRLLELHLQRLDETTSKLDEVADFCEALDLVAKRSLQRVGVVRFNPFGDVGSDQSFAVALLDGKGDGLVISSIFGRNDSRVYAKPIDKGQSKYALSGEEEEAIRLAAGQQAAPRSKPRAEGRTTSNSGK